ncbi:MAG: SH3 domain-containing protein [Oceanidesulfovibrio sp.]
MRNGSDRTASHAIAVLVFLVAFTAAGAATTLAQCPPGTAWFKGRCRPVFPESSTPSTQGRMMEVTASTLNMRSCPSLRCGVVDVLHNGAVVEVLGNDSGFSRITVPGTGETGWVSDRYLTPTRQFSTPGTGPGRPPLTEPRYE